MNLNDILEAGKAVLVKLIRAGKITVPEKNIIFPQRIISKSSDPEYAASQSAYIEITAARWHN